MDPEGPPAGRPTGPAAVLGVAPGADDDELRRAWRRHARRHHPDHGGDRRRFEEGAAAYAALRAASPPPGRQPLAPPVDVYRRGLGDLATRLLLRSARRLGVVAGRVR